MVTLIIIIIIIIIITRAKDVLPKINRTQAAEITPAATEWFRPLIRDVICSERVPFRRCRELWQCRARAFVPGDLDRDIQTHPSDGLSTSSLWIWRKSVQPFLRYLIHKQTQKNKTHFSQTALKQNLTCGNNNINCDNVYGAVIMTTAIARVLPVH